MDKVDMHQASFISETAYDLTDSWSESETFPDHDFFFGGTNDIKNVSYKKVTNAGKTFYTLTYERAMKTPDTKYDYQFSDGTHTLTAAWGLENYPVFHGDRVYEGAVIISGSTVTLATGNPNQPKQSTPTMNARMAFETHGIILETSWAISFFGVIAARFFRHKGYWVWIHGVTMGLPTVATLALSIEALLASKLFLNF
ncbi:MAG: hypothetical protein GY861_25490 [bacterium]|nr:hypothetical protein [bacterium]